MTLALEEGERGRRIANDHPILLRYFRHATSADGRVGFSDFVSKIVNRYTCQEAET